jgi:BolA protein
MTQSERRAVREVMEEKLSTAFAPQFLRVIDESHKHAGHMGHQGGAGHGGETHFRVEIVAERFSGKNSLAASTLCLSTFGRRARSEISCR